MLFIKEVKTLIENDVTMLMASKKCSKAELAKRIGDSPQNLGLKFKRETLKTNDLQKILEALEIDAEITYTDKKTGKEIFKSRI